MSGLPFTQHMDTIGDGSGTVNAIGDYATTPTTFKYAPIEDEVAVLSRMVILIQDGGTFDADKYGALAAALTNGISLKVYRDNLEIRDLMGGQPITSNAEWGQVCYDMKYEDFGGGSANKFLLVRWSFDRSGTPLRLRGNSSDELRIAFTDNFTGLVAHRFALQGFFAG